MCYLVDGWTHRHTHTQRITSQGSERKLLSLETRGVVGKYKVEVFDKDKRTYEPATGGLGMHVEVRDPEDKTLMSRVSIYCRILHKLSFYHCSHLTVV